MNSTRVSAGHWTAMVVVAAAVVVAMSIGMAIPGCSPRQPVHTADNGPQPDPPKPQPQPEPQPDDEGTGWWNAPDPDEPLAADGVATIGFTAEHENEVRQVRRRFRLQVAATPEQRDAVLDDDALREMPRDAALLVVWPAPRKIALTMWERNAALIVVPVTWTKGAASVSGSAVELRTVDQSTPPEEPAFAPPWAGRWVWRNWEFVAPEPTNAMAVLRTTALEHYHIRRFDHPMGEFPDPVTIDLPANARDIEAKPDPEYATITLERGRARQFQVPVRVHSTDAARRSGLAGKSLPPFADDQPVRGELLMFHRHRDRPIFTGGLQAPYDLVLFDQFDRVDRVTTISDDNPLLPDTWTRAAGRFVLLLPAGYVKSLSAPGLAGHYLVLPPRLSIWRADPVVWPIRVGDKTAHVEIVQERDWRNRGLMWRRELAPDHGMLFLYPSAEMRSFWMLNCLLDISAAYIAPDWTITDPIVTMRHPLRPGDDPTSGRSHTMDALGDEADNLHESGAPARYVLEMAPGWFEANGIKPGTKIVPGKVAETYMRRAE